MGTDYFKLTITELSRRTGTETNFRTPIRQPEKNIDDCLHFHHQTTRRQSGWATGFAFGRRNILALGTHYYDEEDIDIVATQGQLSR